MHRCACSTVALELFIKDFASLNLRQQRAQRFFQQCRPFSTRPSLQGPDTTNVPKQERTDSAEVQADSAKPTSVPRTKVQNRMLRKLKRIEEGKFGASASEQSRHAHAFSSSAPAIIKEKEPEPPEDQQDYDYSQIEHVTKKIDALKGPSILKQQATKKERMVQKSLEKRQRKQRQHILQMQEKAEKKTEEEKTKKLQLIKADERWKVDKGALQKKFGETGWQPRKRLSPDSLEGIRALHASDPATYKTEVLAANFEVSPESIRRILRGKWQPTEDERAERMERWERRGVRKWEEMSSKGMKPPKKWRAMGVPNPKLQPIETKKWDDSKQDPYVKKTEKIAAAKEKRDWRKELDAAQTPEDVMNLADRIM